MTVKLTSKVKTDLAVSVAASEVLKEEFTETVEEEIAEQFKRDIKNKNEPLWLVFCWELNKNKSIVTKCKDKFKLG